GLAGAAPGSSKATTGTPDANGQVGAAQAFPTFTSQPLPPSAIPPLGTIPHSQTPLPTATARPTPTHEPCQGNCAGGGSTAASVSGYPTPIIWNGGKSVTFTVHTSLPNGQPAPNVGVALIITFPGGGTFLDETGAQTDASGNYVSSINVPGGIRAGRADVFIQANFSGTVVRQHIKVECMR